MSPKGEPKFEAAKPLVADQIKTVARNSAELVQDSVKELHAVLHAQRGPAEIKNLFIENAILPGVDLSSRDCSDLMARGAFLRGADFRMSVLDRAQFHNAILMEANLQGVHAYEAIFESASLQRAHMEEIDAENAIFRGANMAGARLQDAHLEGADFSSCVWKGIDLRGAHFDDATILPNGLSLGEYISESVPRLLAAGGANLATILKPTEWRYSYHDRILLLAFGERDQSKPITRKYADTSCYTFNIPASVAGEIDLFLTLFKAGAIPLARLKGAK